MAISHEESIKSRDDTVSLRIWVASVGRIIAFILAWSCLFLQKENKNVLRAISPGSTEEPDPPAVISNFPRPRGAMGPGYQLRPHHHPCGGLHLDHIFDCPPCLAPILGDGWARHNKRRYWITLEKRCTRGYGQQH